MEEKDNIGSMIIEGQMIPDKDGNIKGNQYAGYEGKIIVTLGKPKRVTSGLMGVEFKMVLPDHIHSKLKGLEIIKNSKQNRILLSKLLRMKKLQESTSTCWRKPLDRVLPIVVF